MPRASAISVLAALVVVTLPGMAGANAIDDNWCTTDLHLGTPSLLLGATQE